MCSFTELIVLLNALIRCQWNFTRRKQRHCVLLHKFCTDTNALIQWSAAISDRRVTCSSRTSRWSRNILARMGYNVKQRLTVNVKKKRTHNYTNYNNIYKRSDAMRLYKNRELLQSVIFWSMLLISSLLKARCLPTTSQLVVWTPANRSYCTSHVYLGTWISFGTQITHTRVCI